MAATAGHADTEVLRLAASLERASEHPLAPAIVAAADARALATGGATDVQALAGRGLRGRVDGRAVAVGNQRLLAELGVDGGRGAGAAGAAAAGADGRVRRRRRRGWPAPWRSPTR